MDMPYKPRWTKTEISKLVADHNPEAIMWDGFEDAFIGMSRRCGQPTLVTYSYKRCIQVLMRRDKVEFDEACEYLEFNVVGGWLGEHTPICVEDLDE